MTKNSYVIINGQLHQVADDELMHYGVLGMRWGVRRAQKRLSKAGTTDTRAKAVSNLNKHRDKATAKIGKLEKRGAKLAKKVDNAVIKVDVEAADLKRKSAILRNRAIGRFGTNKKKLRRADKLAARADALVAKSEQAKIKLASNKKMIEIFKAGISEIDKTLVSSGKKYVG